MKTIRAVIFGAGTMGRDVYKAVCKEMPEIDIVAFADNLESIWGEKCEGLPIINPKQLAEIEYERIFLATTTGFFEVQAQLRALGVPSHKVELRYPLVTVTARASFVRDFSELAQKAQMDGNVAEAGVFRGEFAAVINGCFPNKTIYLFDTFEGFASTDLENEIEHKDAAYFGRYMANTTEQIVLDKLPHPEKAIIRKGYFPSTAEGIEDTFCFVNLDMDLYQPTLEGLHFFYPRMNAGGIILVHDYFSKLFPGIEKSVNDFEASYGSPLCKLPAGDGVSLAIVKY